MFNVQGKRVLFCVLLAMKGENPAQRQASCIANSPRKTTRLEATGITTSLISTVTTSRLERVFDQTKL